MYVSIFCTGSKLFPYLEGEIMAGKGVTMTAPPQPHDNTRTSETRHKDLMRFKPYGRRAPSVPRALKNPCQRSLF